MSAKTKVVSVRLDEATFDLINMISKKTRIKTSTLIQLAIKNFILDDKNKGIIEREQNLLELTELYKKLKQLRFALHVKKASKYYLQALERAKKQEELTIKQYALFNEQPIHTLDKITLLQKQIKKVAENIEKTI